MASTGLLPLALAPVLILLLVLIRLGDRTLSAPHFDIILVDAAPARPRAALAFAGLARGENA